MTTTPSLIAEVQQRADRVEADTRRRKGAAEYEAALAPEGVAAHARIAGRRAMLADGVSVAALDAALLTFADHPDYATSPRAAKLRGEAAGTLRQARELLTETRCAQDEARITRIVQWTDNDWALPEWIRINIEKLRSGVPAAPDVRGLLDTVAWWEAEILKHLRNDRAPSSSPGPLATEATLRAGSQDRAHTSTVHD